MERAPNPGRRRNAGRAARAAALLAGLALAAQAGATPALFYTDLDSAPASGGPDGKGAFVTLYGARFGSAPGAVRLAGDPLAIQQWGERRVVLRLGTGARSGELVLADAQGQASNALPFTVRPGRVFFVAPDGHGRGSEAAPMGPGDVLDEIRPGDVFYFRGGTYRGEYGPAYGHHLFALGPLTGGRAGSPVAFAGYPGEAAVLEAPGEGGNVFGVRDRDELDGHANYLTIANLDLRGGFNCVGGGGVVNPQPKTGVRGLRVVGNSCTAGYRGNTLTGLVDVANDGARILGNDFHDAGTNPPIKNNHAVYVSFGAGDVEIGWNRFHDLRMGHLIQVHTDRLYHYADIRIHDNELSARDPGDCRGINIGNVDAASYGAIWNNVLQGLGQDFSGIAIYGGSWAVYNNTLAGIHATAGMIWLNGSAFGNGNQPRARVFNNLLVSDGASPYVAALSGAREADLELSNNLYENGRGPLPRDAAAVTGDPRFVDAAHGDLHLQAGSPALDRGSEQVVSVLATDHDGLPRPQGRGIDIGAYERAADSLAAPTGLGARP